MAIFAAIVTMRTGTHDCHRRRCHRSVECGETTHKLLCSGGNCSINRSKACAEYSTPRCSRIKEITIDCEKRKCIPSWQIYWHLPSKSAQQVSLMWLKEGGAFHRNDELLLSDDPSRKLLKLITFAMYMMLAAEMPI